MHFGVFGPDCCPDDCRFMSLTYEPDLWAISYIVMIANVASHQLQIRIWKISYLLSEPFSDAARMHRLRSVSGACRSGVHKSAMIFENDHQEWFSVMITKNALRNDRRERSLRTIVKNLHHTTRNGSQLWIIADHKPKLIQARSTQFRRLCRNVLKFKIWTNQ